MWPAEGWPRRSGHAPEVLRIGRRAVERWRVGSADFVRIASAPVEPPARACPASPLSLVAPLQGLWAQRPTSAITVVIESAWMPLLLAPLGRAILARPQLDALLRHRFDSLYGDGGEPVSTWAVRVDYRPGDATALAYTLPPAIERMLRELADEGQWRCQALLPAFGWGQAWRPKGVTGWWLWPEQDRLLVTRWVSGRVVALNTAAAPSADPTAIESLVQAEAVRWGVAGERANTEPICIADWGPQSLPPSMDRPIERLRWIPIGRPIAKALR